MKVKIRLKDPGNQALARPAAILARQLAERSGAEIISAGPETGSELAVALAIDPAAGREGYRIADGAPGEIIVAGGDRRGLIYGVGRLLHEAVYSPGEFRPGPWRGASVPDKPVRGLYFATHFHNYYHDAPPAEIEKYLEELVLWGYNALVAWYDMNHYRGLDDPDSRAMIERLRHLFSFARELGLDIGLVTVANESYRSSPRELGRVPEYAFMPGLLCPNKPGGRELILKNMAGEFEAFAGLKLDFIWTWPYDPGSCFCEKCRPWGGNGFIEMSREIAGLARRYHPSARLVLSTWTFKPEDWEGLARAFRERPDWVDYIMADAHREFPEFPLKHGVPGGLPLLNFPEISMIGMKPWGGFGATPTPARLQGFWPAAADRIAGGFPYSEGLHDDINKVIISRFYWNRKTSALEALREYAHFEYGPGAVERVLEAVGIIEANHGRYWDVVPQAPGFIRKREAPEVRDSGRAARLLEEVDRELPEARRRGWRWRLLLLRGRIERELRSNGGVPNDACDEAFEELIAILHAERAEWRVAPLSRRLVARLDREKKQAEDFDGLGK